MAKEEEEKEKVIKTIFDVKQYTHLILSVFTGMKNPLDNNQNKKKYNSSWYQVVRPNLEEFSLSQKPVNIGKKDIEMNKGDFNFLSHIGNARYGKNIFETNSKELIKYFIEFIEKEYWANIVGTQSDEIKKIKEIDTQKIKEIGIKRFKKEFKVKKRFEKKFDERAYNSNKSRLYKLFVQYDRLSQEFDEAYIKNKKEEYYSKWLTKIERIDNFHFFTKNPIEKLVIERVKNKPSYYYITELFKRYCNQVLEKGLYKSSTFNELISEFMIGLSNLCEIDLLFAAEISDEKLDNYAEGIILEQKVLARFILLCKFYEECLKIKENKNELKQSKTMSIIVRLLWEYIYADKMRNKFIRMPNYDSVTPPPGFEPGIATSAGSYVIQLHQRGNLQDDSYIP